MLVAFLLAAVTAAPTPWPASTAPPVIVRVRSSEACSALRTIALPVGFIAKRDDAAFTGINVAMLKFVGGFEAFDAPTASALAQAVGDAPAATGETAQQAIESGGAESQDDSVTFNGQSILSAAHVDSIAERILGNLTLADRYMALSWKSYPVGKDPVVDTLRQRAQNLIDLQRSLATRYEEFAGSYLDNMGGAAIVREDQRTGYKTLLRAFVLGEASDLLNPDTTGSDSASPLAEVSEFKKSEVVADLVRELRKQEAAFSPAVYAEFRSCR